MESELSPEDALAAVEAGAAAPYIDYPPTPWWYFPAFGLWAGALVLAVGGIVDRPAVYGPLLIALVALEVWFISWYENYRGSMPDLRRIPPEFRPAVAGYVAGLIGIVALVVALFVLVHPVVAAGQATVSVTIGLLVYEKRYEEAAAATRRRLAAGPAR